MPTKLAVTDPARTASSSAVASVAASLPLPGWSAYSDCDGSSKDGRGAKSGSCHAEVTDPERPSADAADETLSRLGDEVSGEVEEEATDAAEECDIRRETAPAFAAEGPLRRSSSTVDADGARLGFSSGRCLRPSPSRGIRLRLGRACAGVGAAAEGGDVGEGRPPGGKTADGGANGSRAGIAMADADAAWASIHTGASLSFSKGGSG